MGCTVYLPHITKSLAYLLDNRVEDIIQIHWSMYFHSENASEDIVCKMADNISQLQFVEYWTKKVALLRTVRQQKQIMLTGTSVVVARHLPNYKSYIDNMISRLLISSHTARNSTSGAPDHYSVKGYFLSESLMNSDDYIAWVTSILYVMNRKLWFPKQVSRTWINNYIPQKTVVYS